MQLTLLDHNIQFPPLNSALDEPNGLLAVGGDLSVERLLLAYQNGIFPWYSPNEPILWWSPDPRAVLLPNQVHISRSMAKFMRKTDYTMTINHDFIGVITACAETHKKDGIWITQDIQAAYIQLHQLGFAHSIEVWHNNQLIGGLYGVAQGKLFCGESMFSRQPNASKFALIKFSQYFVNNGGQLIDCQVLNDHTESLGAIEITRDNYVQLLQQCQQHSINPDCWQPKIVI